MQRSSCPRKRRPTRSALLAFFFLPLFLFASSPVAPAHADERPTSVAANAAQATAKTPDIPSPRAAISGFLREARRRRFDAAAAYLEIPKENEDRAAELAKKLNDALSRAQHFDASNVSMSPEGDLRDGLEEDAEEITAIRVSADVSWPIRLARVEENGTKNWKFSYATVSRVDQWNDSPRFRWVFENLPAPLLKEGPHELMWWQWLSLPVLLLIAWAIGFVLSRLTTFIFKRVTHHTSTHWDDVAVERLTAPLILAWSVGAARTLTPFLGLYGPVDDAFKKSLRAALLFAGFWAILRIIDVSVTAGVQSPWATNRPASRTLIPLGGRVAKVVVTIIGVVTVLSDLGYPVASLIAGLGIGGLAVALAAQKTFENVFGAFALGIDQPLREGDYVKIDDFQGTVEAIGLRSTRIRTLDRTVVTVPNGQLAEKRVESFTARDRMRLFCTVGLVYGTTSEQIKSIIAEFEKTLRDEPTIWPEAVRVYLAAFADSSINIEVMAWFQTLDGNEFQEIRQRVLLRFMEIVERAGSDFAFPTRTVHVVESGRNAPDLSLKPA